MTRQTKTPGHQLKRRREAAGLSRLQLAYRAGVDLRTIERIERGEVSEPRRATAEAIEGVLAEAA